jgi:excisionase family DNA binding protein
MEPHFTVAEVAKLAHFCQMTIYRKVWNGEIKASRIGRSVRIPKSEVYRLMQNTPSFRERCAREANAFMAEHPDYFPTVGNEQGILNFLDDNNMPVTAPNIAIAYEQLKAAGALEFRPTPAATKEAPNA